MKKLSAIMIELAEQVLAQPVNDTSDEGFHAALLLAHVAWNRTVEPNEADTHGHYHDVLAHLERENPKTRGDLKSYDCEELIGELMQFKRTHYPEDDRFIYVCGTTQEGNVHVEWIHKKTKQNKPRRRRGRPRG